MLFVLQFYTLFYEHIHLCPKRSLRICFSHRCKDLIRAYPWSKKDLINDWEIIIAYWEEFEQSEALANKCGLLQKIAGWFGVVAAVQPQENFILI